MDYVVFFLVFEVGERFDTEKNCVPCDDQR